MSRTTEPTQVTRRTEFRYSIRRALQRRRRRIRRQPLKRNPLGNTHSITEKPQNSAPMLWDQIEDAAPEHSLTAESQASTVAEVLPALSGCPDPPPPVAEDSGTSDRDAGRRCPSVEQRPESLAGMTMDQVDAAVTGSSMVGGCDGPTGNEVVLRQPKRLSDPH